MIYHAWFKPCVFKFRSHSVQKPAVNEIDNVKPFSALPLWGCARSLMQHLISPNYTTPFADLHSKKCAPQSPLTARWKPSLELPWKAPIWVFLLKNSTWHEK